jgi:hypothetical protein
MSAETHDEYKGTWLLSFEGKGHVPKMEDGIPDWTAYASGTHNGPVCTKCGYARCMWCIKPEDIERCWDATGTKHEPRDFRTDFPPRRPFVNPSPAHIDTTAPEVIRAEDQVRPKDRNEYDRQANRKPTPSPIDTTGQEPDKKQGYDCANECGDSLYWSESDKAWVHERSGNYYCDMGGESYIEGVPLIPAPASIATTQGDEIDQAYRVGRAVGRILAEAEPKPAPQAEAQEIFEQWRQRNKDKYWMEDYAYTDLDITRVAQAAWNAQQAKIDALEQKVGELEKEVHELRCNAGR